MSNEAKRIRDELMAPMLTTTRSYWVMVGISVSIILVGIIAWIYQVVEGLGVTGLTQRIFWGIYISNFIFFIGISYSGTLISAILRLTNAGWRTPLTRMAEQITVIGIIVGFSMILFDMGRPDRVFYVPYASRLQSPLFWDMLSVSTYLMGSLIFFYLPLIPDMAILRDHFREVEGGGIFTSFRRKFYSILALGWKGTPSQKKALDKAIGFMSVILIPIAIMCHTVIAFIFAMTWRVGWHSTIFGPYFVVAAIFSGTAAIIIVMTILRKVYRLEEYITFRHYRNMSYVLFLLLGGYMYFTVTEYFTTAYRAGVHDMELLEEMFYGRYAVYFWFFIVLGMIIPGLLLLMASWRYESERSVWVIFSASVMIVLGMWVKRYIIIIPALARPFVEQEWSIYEPTWVEWAITFAGGAGFVLAFAVFTKLFPLISIWEIQEEYEKEHITKISKILKSGKLTSEEE
jgi:molybdopterin-containing oxidoreductase family membrane subunit